MMPHPSTIAPLRAERGARASLSRAPSFPDYRQMRPLPSAFRHGRMVIRHYQSNPAANVPSRISSPACSGTQRLGAFVAAGRLFFPALDRANGLSRKPVPHEGLNRVARAVIHFQNVLSSSLALVGFDLNESELTHAKASFASGTKDHD